MERNSKNNEEAERHIGGRKKNKMPESEKNDDKIKVLRICIASDDDTDSSSEEDESEEEEKGQKDQEIKKKKDGVANGGVKKSKKRLYGKRIRGRVFFVFGADINVLDLVIPENEKN